MDCTLYVQVISKPRARQTFNSATEGLRLRVVSGDLCLLGRTWRVGKRRGLEYTVTEIPRRAKLQFEQLPRRGGKQSEPIPGLVNA